MRLLFLPIFLLFFQVYASCRDLEIIYSVEYLVESLNRFYATYCYGEPQYKDNLHVLENLVALNPGHPDINRLKTFIDAVRFRKLKPKEKDILEGLVVKLIATLRNYE